jgi:HEAT repeat protein
MFLMASWLRADDDSRDSFMYKDPEIRIAEVRREFPPDLIDAWLVGLRRPEADYQSRAALTVILAHQQGMKGLEVTIDPLMEILVGAGHHDMARLSAARALVELDARQAADAMLRQSKAGDHDLRDIIEPALASWKYEPARQLWLERLQQADVPMADLILAIRGLAVFRASEAASRLTEMVDSAQVSWPLRMEAARALGVIRTSGGEAEALRLLAGAVSYEPFDRTPAATSTHLAAAWLLHRHHSEEATRLLQGLARDAEPAVVFVALQALLQIDSKLALPMLDSALASSDAKVRSLGVETILREATVERLRLLADKLDDPHPEVRIKARHALQDLASRSQLKDEVIKQGMPILAGQDWRGLEQATILMARVNHKPAAGRIAELLQSERPEVFVTAAWGLRKLAVPETLPAALKRFRDAQLLAKNPGARAALHADPPLIRELLSSTEEFDEQLSHLAQFMGQSRYQAADTALRRQVPRTRDATGEDDPVIGQETRAASIWALGFIHQGKPDLPLVKELEGRLNDISRPFHPGEDPRIRSMSAISLARMKSKDSLHSIRLYRATAKPTLDPIAHACSWSIHELTGEPTPAPGVVELPAGNFKNWLRSEPKSVEERLEKARSKMN